MTEVKHTAHSKMHGPPIVTQYREARETVDSLAHLPRGWDTYGSRPIQSQAVQGALFLLGVAERMGLPAPRISPVSGGGIQLDWTGTRRDLEVEILPDGSVEYLKVESGDQLQEGSLLSYHEDGVQDCLRWLLPPLSGDV